MADIIIKQEIQEKLIDINQISSIKFENSKWPVPGEEEWRRTNLAKYNLNGFNISQDAHESPSIISKNIETDQEFSIFIKKTKGVKTAIIIDEVNAESVIIYDPSSPVKLNEITSNLIVKLAENTNKRVDNKLNSLALSSFKDSLFIIVPDNLELDKPIIVEFDSGDENKAFLPNLFVSAGNNSQVKIIQKIKSSDGSSVTGVLNVLCGDNSNIQTATVTDTGSDSLVFLNRFFNLSREAYLSDFQSCSGGRLIKTRTEIDLNGKKADARIFGVVFAEKNTQIDMRTVQHHKEKDCFSQAMIKSVVKDKGRSIYQGLIEVEEDASLTDAYLTNNNLVLNNGARADSIPSLKIRNNDVKCSHGSTTGRINEEQVLYLTSRGISKDEARQMILEGFLGSVYDNLTEDINLYCSPFIMNKILQREVVY